jgi:hypothetical protein
MNKVLKAEILSMAEADQRVLQELAENGEISADEYHPSIQQVHIKNTARMKAIIGQYGWPGNALVGEEGAEAAWMVVQHSVLDRKFMQLCVPLLEQAVKKNEAQGWHLAFLRDRLLTLAGQPQIYGTQFDHDEEGWPVPFPIANPANVNQKRAELGLNSLEERIAEMRRLEQWVRDQREKVEC